MHAETEAGAPADGSDAGKMHGFSVAWSGDGYRLLVAHEQEGGGGSFDEMQLCRPRVDRGIEKGSAECLVLQALDRILLLRRGSLASKRGQALTSMFVLMLAAVSSAAAVAAAAAVASAAVVLVLDTSVCGSAAAAAALLVSSERGAPVSLVKPK